MHDAWAKLRAGRTAESLAILAEHEREYPRGVLREEAMAAKVLALCAAGRDSEARRWAERFREHYPESPLGRRVGAACGTAFP